MFKQLHAEETGEVCADANSGLWTFSERVRIKYAQVRLVEWIASRVPSTILSSISQNAGEYRGRALLTGISSADRWNR